MKCQLRNVLISIPFGRMEFSYCDNGLHMMHFRNVDFSVLKKQLNESIDLNGKHKLELIDCSVDDDDLAGLSCIDYLNNYFSKRSNPQ